MHNDVTNALEVLHTGGIIIYPTDTIWGIGCDATNEEAVAKIYNIKQRSEDKNMLVLLHNANRITSYIDSVPEIAWELIEVADKPLTIIYEGAKNLAKNLIADDGTVGIRIVKHAFCEKLLERFKKPIVSTSANISGFSSPTCFSEISDEVLKKADYIVQHEQEMAMPNEASQIIKLGAGGEIKIIRK
jgi:L-threonylcarbamoyladenylate synthase